MARVYIPRFDPKLAEAFRKVSVGLGVKTLGYLFIVGGIFFSLKDKDFALHIVATGVFLVVMGWIMVWIGLKKSSRVKEQDEVS
ncbi:MAG: hypothetical protein ACLFVX_04050 [Archaeoglobaceae archaeon]